MTVAELIAQVQNTPDQVEFAQVIEVIDQNYDFVPTAFVNGNARSEAGQNNGSCKLFSFARLQGLNPAQTLALFGAYYRVDVLQNPDAQDHANIRNFMQQGWEGLSFEAEALSPKV